MSKKANPHVPEQLRGFTAQETRLASLLLDAPEDSWVSMELLDDVAQEDQDGTILVVQSKDTEATNPIADRSIQMWKTFANWARDVREDRLDATRTTFEIYVCRKVNGKLAKVFVDANTKQAALEAFEKARSLLWGEPPTYTKKDHVAATLRPHLEEVFETSAKAFRSIIEKFQITCAVKNPELDLLGKVKHRMAFEPDDLVAEVVVDVCGWVRSLVAHALRNRKAPVIRAGEFMNHLKASYSKLKPGGALTDIGAKEPSPSDVAKLLCEQFVRQMDLINSDDETRNRAMTCLFKARTARTKWSERGEALVHDSDIREFEDGLKQVWRNLRTDVFSDPHRTDEILRGQLLLAKCESHTCPVEQKTVPAYFIPGCFHELANRLALGWHPKFESILRSLAA